MERGAEETATVPDKPAIALPVSMTNAPNSHIADDALTDLWTSIWPSAGASLFSNTLLPGNSQS
jgi:hypothetical protein